MNTLLNGAGAAVCALLWILFPLLLLGGIVHVLILETDRERAQRLRSTGLSQAAIAQRMGCTRYRVRKLLA